MPQHWLAAESCRDYAICPLSASHVALQASHAIELELLLSEISGNSHPELNFQVCASLMTGALDHSQPCSQPEPQSALGLLETFDLKFTDLNLVFAYANLTSSLPAYSEPASQVLLLSGSFANGTGRVLPGFSPGSTTATVSSPAHIG